MNTSLSRKNTLKALQAFQKGEIIVIMDDNGRENEGDLILAAVHCTSQKMAFIIRHTSGIVCAAMQHKEAKRLHLPLMVSENDSFHSTAFTITVDYRHGTTTGISAHDRTLTVRNLANPEAEPTDFVRPGHIFPLIAREGGLLSRSGHTEAAVDLCRIAKLPPVGVLCELLNDDGTIMRGYQLIKFIKQHHLYQTSVADLITYRQEKETLLHHLATIQKKTAIGNVRVHRYQLPWEQIQHLAIVIGDISDGENIPVYLSYEDVLSDVFGKTCEPERVLKKLKEKYKRGVLVYLRYGLIEIKNKSVSQNMTCTNKNQKNQEKHTEAIIREKKWCKIGLGAQILKHLGLHSILLLLSKEQQYIKFEEFGIYITRIERI